MVQNRSTAWNSEDMLKIAMKKKKNGKVSPLEWTAFQSILIKEDHYTNLKDKMIKQNY